MVMDFLRTMYLVPARFYAGDQRGEQMIWYDAPLGAKLYPFVHRFGSQLYSKALDVGNTVGEVPGAHRIYSKGAPTRPVAGTNFCGGQDSFLLGAPPLSIARPQRPDNSYLCCDKPPLLCQPFEGSLPQTFAQGPGYGPQVADEVGTTFYRWDNVAGFGWQLLLTQNPIFPCSGSHFISRLFLQQTGFPGQQYECTLVRLITTTQGLWVVPTASPKWPGQAVVVDNPNTVP